MCAYSLRPTQSVQRAEYLLEDPTADLLTLHDLRRRARDGRLRIAPVPQAVPFDREVHTVSETPVEGAGAVARWVALLDRAEHLRRDSPSDHPTVERQIARAIESLFLYEHQMLPAARRQARAYLWQRDRTEPLPPAQQRAEWERCRCRKCLLARLMQRPAVARQLAAAAPGESASDSAPASASVAERAPRLEQRRLLPLEAQAS